MNLGAQLSGGEQQMLAIGRALMTHPELIVLDEATEGLVLQKGQVVWQGTTDDVAGSPALATYLGV